MADQLWQMTRRREEEEVCGYWLSVHCPVYLFAHSAVEWPRTSEILCVLIAALALCLKALSLESVLWLGLKGLGLGLEG